MFEEGKTNDTLKGVIAFSDIGINITDYYTGLYNSRSNQLLSFFIEDSTITNNGITKSMYLLNLVYFEKKSKKWKHKFIIKDNLSSTNFSKDEQIIRMFYKIGNIGFFKENSIDVNDKFWKKKLFIKNDIQF